MVEVETKMFEPESLVSPALAGGFFITEPPGKPILQIQQYKTDHPDSGWGGLNEIKTFHTVLFWVNQ